MRTLLSLALALPVGCGESHSDLSGTVSYKTKPVCSGSVQVVGTDGLPKGAPIRPDGTFLIKDIVAGPIKIAVNSPNAAMVKVIPRKKADTPPPATPDPKWFPIPERFGDFEKSELRFSLKPGLNTIPLELTDK